MKTKQITQEPSIDVGIMTAPEIAFVLHKAAYLAVYRRSKAHQWICEDRVMLPQGDYRIVQENKQLSLYVQGIDTCLLQAGKRYQLQALDGSTQDIFFSLKAVRIGIDFHWDRLQDQCFVGELHLLLKEEEGGIIAINRLPLEDYLLSVISSEMSAHAGLELLRAHAIISRSWLLAQGLGQHLLPPHKKEQSSAPCGYDTENEHIRWYERDAHLDFDVCADDHCQRYQGFQQSGTPQAKEALLSTRGMVLACEDDICDARFYKCCGGKTECFEAAWADAPKSYLQSIHDNKQQLAGDLRDEAQARAFILSKPEAFCNTDKREVLQQVLNYYDQETADFYRWEQRYSVEELSEIIKMRSGIDFGRIQALIPIERSHSARLVKLKIVGEKRSLIVGKELEIRKFLSRSHLYSSAFVVDECRNEKGEVETFILKGAGWGHGVGLCQIGAAMMCHEGYAYDAILHHYYPNTDIVKLY